MSQKTSNFRRFQKILVLEILEKWDFWVIPMESRKLPNVLENSEIGEAPEERETFVELPEAGELSRGFQKIPEDQKAIGAPEDSGRFQKYSGNSTKPTPRNHRRFRRFWKIPGLVASVPPSFLSPSPNNAFRTMTWQCLLPTSCGACGLTGRGNILCPEQSLQVPCHVPKSCKDNNLRLLTGTELHSGLVVWTGRKHTCMERVSQQTLRGHADVCTRRMCAHRPPAAVNTHPGRSARARKGRAPSGPISTHGCRSISRLHLVCS